jgi:Chemotaxis phosphatase CheX
MDALQLKLFRQITLDYFHKLAPEDLPEMGEPYLQFGDLPLLEYTSLVRIRGEYEGFLALSAPVDLIAQLLAINKEPEVSERTLRDMCRELANVLSGNASKAFGGFWEISVPFSLEGSGVPALDLPPSAFVMPFKWRGTTALLTLGLELPRKNRP